MQARGQVGAGEVSCLGGVSRGGGTVEGGHRCRVMVTHVVSHGESCEKWVNHGESWLLMWWRVMVRHVMSHALWLLTSCRLAACYSLLLPQHDSQ